MMTVPNSNRSRRWRPELGRERRPPTCERGRHAIEEHRDAASGVRQRAAVLPQLEQPWLRTLEGRAQGASPRHPSKRLEAIASRAAAQVILATDVGEGVLVPVQATNTGTCAVNAERRQRTKRALAAGLRFTRILERHEC